MKVLAVGSPHTASTRDVWKKLVIGLSDNGIEVQPFDLLPRVSIFEQMAEMFKRRKLGLPEDWTATTMAYEPILGAAIFHDCDMVVVVSPQYFPTAIAGMLRKVGIKTAAYFTECPYEDEIHMPLVASTFDYSLVSDLHSVALFQSFCENVMYVPHSYIPALHYPPENDDARENNTVFVGTGYTERSEFMAKVDWPVPVDVHGGFWKWPKKVSKQIRTHNATSRKRPFTRLTETISTDKDAPPASAVVGPEDCADLYRAAGTSFSLHRSQKYWGAADLIMEGDAYSLGPRNWELAACRTWQCSDFREELVDVFGDSVPLYETPRELGQLLKRAFADPAWRKELAFQQWEKAQPYSAQNVMRPVAQFLAA
jgi:spore maturation protein CgeB